MRFAIFVQFAPLFFSENGADPVTRTLLDSPEFRIDLLAQGAKVVSGLLENLMNLFLLGLVQAKVLVHSVAIATHTVLGIRPARPTSIDCRFRSSNASPIHV